MTEKTKQKNILIVDDDEGFCRSLKLVFNAHGYDTNMAHTGNEALEKAGKNDYDLAVLDIMLPDMNGTELLKYLEEACPDMAMIMITGHASVDTAVKTLTGTASAYFIKPVNMDEVVKKTTKILETQHLIREKIRAEKALRESEARWRSLVENAPNIITTVGPNGIIQFLNRPVRGLAIEDVVGRHAADFVVPEQHDLLRESIEHVFVTGETMQLETASIAQDSTVAWFDSHIGPIRYGKHVDSLVLITTDITDKKRSEAIILESELKYKTLVEQSLEGIVIAQASPLRLSFVNTSMARILGRTSDELTSMSPSELRTLIHPDDQEMLFQNFNNRIQKKSAPNRYEVRAVRRDGTIV